jgi:undecaprenyl-phosphate 4-deoxy-4-formamido-L-arabinose transferase
MAEGAAGAVASAPKLSVIVPVFRSAACLRPLVEAIGQAFSPGGARPEVILVNDGSGDDSWEEIERLCALHPNVIGVDLRRNFGQDNAILTGLRHARGAYVAIVDDDLQHDPADLPRLLRELDAGADVVYAQFRSKRHRLWKNLGSWLNGKTAELLLGKPPGLYLSPYKVLRREVAALVCRHAGPDPYVDALLFQATSRISQVRVDHRERAHGASNYTFRKSVGVWARLVFACPAILLRLATGCGMASLALGALVGLGALGASLLHPGERGGAWAAAATFFVGGVQLFCLGVLGECVGRTHRAISGCPQAAVRATCNGAGRPGDRESGLAA